MANSKVKYSSKNKDVKVAGRYEEMEVGGEDKLSPVDIGANNVGEDDRPKFTADQLDEDQYTVEQAVDRIGFGKFQVKLSIITGLAWMADACEMMILSILSPALHCDWWLTGSQQALLTTVVFAGMMLSSSMWGWICDKYGRRTALVLSAVYTFYFGVLSAFSPTLIWILLLRGLVGFGIGGAPQSVTLYSEFLPQKTRAKCIVLIELSWAIGAGFEVLLALIVMPTLGWRWLLALSAFPLLIFACSCAWLPESARYLVACGQTDKALKTIEKIARENGRPMPVGKLVDASSAHSAKRGSFSDLFIPEMRWTTLLLWFIWLATAFAYYGVVLMTTELFEGEANRGSCHVDISRSGRGDGPAHCLLECKQLTTRDYQDLLWTTLAEFPGLFITAMIIDRIGRKKTMAIEFLVFAIFTFLLCICTERSLVTFFIFVARAFISGAFQAAYVYTPEVYPTVTRAVGLGACSGMARIGAIVTPFVAQVMLRYDTNMAVVIYGVTGILAAGASLLLPIETSGREMKDVQMSYLPPS